MPKPKLSDYDNLVAHAVTRGLKPTELDPGEFHLCGTAFLAFQCSLSKGVQTSARATFRPEWARVLGQLLKGLKVPSGSVARHLSKAIAAAETASSLDEHTLAAQACILGIADGQPMLPRAGNTKLAGTVKLVSFEPN
jgi:hypothetical protein